MEATRYGIALAIGVALIVTGIVLMVRAKRSTEKDAAHVRLFGVIDVKTRSFGSLIFVMGCAILIPSLVPFPASSDAKRERAEGSAINVNTYGGGSPGVGSMTGGAIAVNVQKNANQK